MATSLSPAVRAALLDRVYCALLRQPVDDPPPEPPGDRQKEAAGLDDPAASEGAA